MFKHLFHISVVLFVALFSAVTIVFVLLGVFSIFRPSLLTDTSSFWISDYSVGWRLLLWGVLGGVALLIAAILSLLQRFKS